MYAESLEVLEALYTNHNYTHISMNTFEFIASLSLFRFLTNSSVQRLILRRPEQPLRPRLRLSPLLNTQAQYTIDDPRKMRRIGAIIAFRGELEQCTGWRGELGGYGGEQTARETAAGDERDRALI